MLRGLRAPLVLVFVVLLSHGPSSWGHTHRDLGAQQLHEHLEIYHAGGSDTDLPEEWHYHLTWLLSSRLCQAVGETGPEAIVNGLSPLQSLEWLRHESQTTPLHIDRRVENELLRRLLPPSSVLHARGLKQRETYKLLGVLLI